MAQAVTTVLMLGAFLGAYEGLRRRARRRDGVKPPVRWRWLLVVLGCAAVAIAAGVLAR